MSHSVEELVSRAYDFGVIAERENLSEEEKDNFLQELQGDSA